MRVLALTRASTLKQEDSPEVQTDTCRQAAKRLGLPEPEIRHEPLGTSGRKTKFREREQGRIAWTTLTEGDVLIVANLRRLGRNVRDIRETLDHFHDRKVRVVVLDFLGGQGMDIDGPIGQLIVTIMAVIAQIQAENGAEDTRRHMDWCKQTGRVHTRHAWGKKRVPSGQKKANGKPLYLFQWDMDFLDLAAKLVHRVRCGERRQDVVREFQEMGLKDWRGKPFLQAYDRCGNVADENSPAAWWQAAMCMKKFIRALRAGELPPPFAVPEQVDRGRATKALTWIDAPNFTNPRPQRKELVTPVDRSLWTAADWRREYMQQHGMEETTDELIAEIKELLTQPAHAMPAAR